MTDKHPMRLNAYVARAGYGSKREATKLIAAGRVQIAGQVVTNPLEVVDAKQTHVRVDKKLIKKLWPLVYVAMNKPARTITATKDTRDRNTVYELLGKLRPVVQAVGRLDYDTEGVLLFTNDGEMAHALTSPKSHVAKIYRVKVKGHLRRDSLRQLRQGVDIGGYTTLPAQVKVQRRLQANTWLVMTIHEGKYRQVKRMCEAVGHPVVRLVRDAFGPIRAESLKPGEHRYLKEWEIKKLRELVKQQ